MDKAPDAFRTISEVADDLGVPQHVLRFWETRFPQIKPMKRGGGRRYYRRDDVDLLRGIRHLLYGEGYTIRGVQRLLKENGAKSVQGIGRGAPGATVPPPAPDDDAAEATLAAPEDVEADAETDEAEEAEIAPQAGADDEDAEAETVDVDAAAPSLAPPARGTVSFGYQRRNFTVAAPAAPAPSVARAAGRPGTLTAAQRQRLQAALYELGECRRLIEAALKED